MKKIIVCLFLLAFCFADVPAFSNPGIPDYEYLEAWDYINASAGFVTGTITIEKKVCAGKKYYAISSTEGKYFRNDIILNYSDLTPVSDERYDKKGIQESLKWINKDTIRFSHRPKGIDLTKKEPDHNLYSRYAFFFSLRGYPFEKRSDVYIRTYMFEYGDYLTLRVAYQGKTKVKVKAGTFDCYKLELSIGSWQSVFATDKYYLYFTVANPHQFIKFDQKVDSGKWLSNELISYTTKKKK